MPLPLPTKPEALGKWVGVDVPDFIGTTGLGQTGLHQTVYYASGRHGCLFAAKNFHEMTVLSPNTYEPWESPTANKMNSL